MAELFSDAWNNDPEVKDKLTAIGFSSVITCGFKDEDKPRCVFNVENRTSTDAIFVTIYNR